jgi:peptidoglycan hydrolase-like protein with peptidoglycan-binding domain
MHQPATGPAPSPFAWTPRRVRASVALVLALTAGIAANAMLFQRGQVPGPETQGSASDGVVTGIRAAGPMAPAGTAIKTAGLPPRLPGASQGAISAEMKRWQARLTQLESEARDAPANAASPAGAVPPTALEPAIAHRLDAEPVVPVTQQTVRALQRELTERGYDPGPADGNIGLLTHAAIMAYEHDEGLMLTGEPSERLLRRMILGTSLDDGVPRAGSGRDRDTAERLIKGVQKALAGLKYAPGQTDGVLTEETARAIREFEMDQGLVPSGRVSGRLIIRLARVSGKAFVVPVR